MRAFPFVDGAVGMATDPVELILNRTWRPALAITGADGLPATADAGNVLRPSTSLKLSMRIPRPAIRERAADAISRPSRARPALRRQRRASMPIRRAAGTPPAWLPGWPSLWPGASETYFGKPDLHGHGRGRLHPASCAMLGARFPDAQFLDYRCSWGLVSNAHGPNEFLHVPTGQAPADRLRGGRPGRCPSVLILERANGALRTAALALGFVAGLKVSTLCPVINCARWHAFVFMAIWPMGAACYWMLSGRLELSPKPWVRPAQQWIALAFDACVRGGHRPAVGDTG